MYVCSVCMYVRMHVMLGCMRVMYVFMRDTLRYVCSCVGYVGMRVCVV